MENTFRHDGNEPSVRFGFILTREGRAWSEEALLNLTDTVNETWPDGHGEKPGSGILWEAGIKINDPALLANALRNAGGNAFIVLSMPDRSPIIPVTKDGLQHVAGYLDAHAGSGATSWSLLASSWREAQKKGRG